MYFTAGGREKGEDPYYTHLYRVSLDGTGLKLLDPGDASHIGRRVTNRTATSSTTPRASTARPSPILYDTLGNVVPKLETPDLTRCSRTGFKFPEPFKVKADDGITDLYGVMYKPFDFDPTKKYPIIAYVYPGPQTESVTKTFNPRSNNIVARPVRLHRHRGRQPRRPPAAVEVVPQLRLRQPARLRPGRQEGGDRAAGAPASLHRHQPGRHLGPLGRRLHVRGGDARLPRLLQGRRCRSRATTRTTSTTTGGARSTTASRRSRRTAR